MVYLGLSLAFRPPTLGHMEGGTRNALLGLVSEAAHALGCDALQAPLARLEAYLETLTQRPPPEALLELEAEYNRLFVGPMPPTAHPYESVYRNAGGLVMGECALDVLQAYAAAQFVISPEYKDLPEHVAVELEFMSRLCQREGEDSAAAAAAEADELQPARAFLEGHLRCWLPQFSQRVLLTATSPYYGQWAQMADIFTYWDVRRMQGKEEGPQ